MLVSLAGLAVNMVGLFFFHEHHDHGGHEHHGEGGCDHDHDNENMYGVFLHVLADCLGSVGVIFSSMLVKYYGFYVADPICSFVISLMILASSVPFIKATASTLMLRSSKQLSKRTAKARTAIEKVEGVVQCRSLQFWELTPKKAAVATCELLVTEGARRAAVHDEVSTILRGAKARDVTVQMAAVGSVVVPQA